MFDVYVQVNGCVLGGESSVCNAVCASQSGNKVCNPAAQTSVTTSTAIEQAMSAAGSSCATSTCARNYPGTPFMYGANDCCFFTPEGDVRPQWLSQDRICKRRITLTIANIRYFFVTAAHPSTPIHPTGTWGVPGASEE